MTTSKKAREAALQALYQLEAQPSTLPMKDGRIVDEPRAPFLLSGADIDVDDALNRYFAHFDAGPELLDAVRRLVVGVTKNVGHLDEALAASSEKWRLDRMDIVDRNVLRLGAFELMQTRGHQRGSIIDGYVNVVKKFGSEDSGAFVNAVLDAVAKNISQPKPHTTAPDVDSSRK